MREAVMKITELSSGEVYWMSGHNGGDALYAFGPDIEVIFLWACAESELKEEVQD